MCVFVWVTVCFRGSPFIATAAEMLTKQLPIIKGYLLFLLKGFFLTAATPEALGCVDFVQMNLSAEV